MYDRHIWCDAQNDNRNYCNAQKVAPRLWNGDSSPIFAGAQSEGEIMFQNWMRLTRDAVLLGMEAQRVMGLRWLKLSRGGRAAEAEAVRMVTEKSNALAEAGMTLARGGSAGTVIRRYRTHVRANKRRLLGD
jgi:hypothetical protein